MKTKDRFTETKIKMVVKLRGLTRAGGVTTVGAKGRNRLKILGFERKDKSMTKEKAWKIVDTLNDILKRVPFCEGVESAAFRERRRELEADGQWGILVDRFEFRGKNLWCRVRLASTDEPEYIEVRACSDTAE